MVASYRTTQLALRWPNSINMEAGRTRFILLKNKWCVFNDILVAIAHGPLLHIFISQSVLTARNLMNRCIRWSGAPDNLWADRKFVKLVELFRNYTSETRCTAQPMEKWKIPVIFNHNKENCRTDAAPNDPRRGKYMSRRIRWQYALHTMHRSRYLCLLERELVVIPQQF